MIKIIYFIVLTHGLKQKTRCTNDECYSNCKDTCNVNDIGDGECDSECNNSNCDNDGGDC